MVPFINLLFKEFSWARISTRIHHAVNAYGSIFELYRELFPAEKRAPERQPALPAWAMNPRISSSAFSFMSSPLATSSAWPFQPLEIYSIPDPAALPETGTRLLEKHLGGYAQILIE